MATGLALITSTQISSTTSTIAFNNLPQNYTDLWIKTILRSTYSSATDGLFVRVNNSSSSIYSRRYMGSNGSSGLSGESYSQSELVLPNMVNGATSTANIFGSGDIYIGNYASTLANKAGWALSGQESSGTTKYLTVNSFSLLTASPITSISFEMLSGGLFAIYSSFYLYGTLKS